MAIRAFLTLAAFTCLASACGRSVSPPAPAASTSVPVLTVESADALRPYADQIVTLRGRASNMKQGVCMNAPDVRVELPHDLRSLFINSTECDVEVTGRLRFISESYWYQSPNDDMTSPIGMVQDYASHQTPVIFRLDPHEEATHGDH